MLTPDTQRQIAHHIGLDTMARIFGLQWDYEHMCAGHQGGVGRGKRYDITGGVLTYGLYGEEQAIKLATLRKTQRQALPRPTVATTPAAPTTQDAPELQKKRSYASTDSVERRLRAAYTAVSGPGGRYRSYNDFRLDAMARLAAEIERELNDGKPFTDAPEKFTPGRKLGSL